MEAWSLERLLFRSVVEERGRPVIFGVKVLGSVQEMSGALAAFFTSIGACGVEGAVLMGGVLEVCRD